MAIRPVDNVTVNPNLLGWHDDPEAVAEIVGAMRPVFADLTPVKDSGAGKTALHYLAQRAVRGEYLYYPAQARGTCVGRSGGQICDLLMDLAVAGGELSGERGRASYASCYAGARVETGYGPMVADGATGAGLMKWLTIWGMLEAIKYTNTDGTVIDLSAEDDALACKWGGRREGVPDWLEPYAKAHPVLKAVPWSTYEELRDGLYGGGVAVLCCNTLFSIDRDSEGFSKPGGRGGHATPIVAVDDEYKRPGVLIDYRSWGKYGSGSKRNDQPDSTTWVDADYVNQVGKSGDNWLYVGAKGFDPEAIHHVLA